MVASTALKFVVLSLGVLYATADKIRPCPNLDNACVGQYLASYSTCTVDLLPLPTDELTLDPHYLDHFFIYSPYFNVTEDRYNITTEGLSQTYVKDFYYNTETNKAALVLFFPYVRASGVTTLHILQTGEDKTIDATTNYEATVVDLTLTTVFNDYKNLELSKSFSFADVSSPVTYNNGQGFTDAAAADSRVAAVLNAIYAAPNVATLEAFVQRAPALVKIFTNFKLCVYSS